MFCTKCGIEIEERASYCYQCGTATGRPSGFSKVPQKLLRSRTNKRIAGVCGGMGKYLDADPTFMRVMWLLLLFAIPPAGLIGYIAAWIAIPMEPYAYPPVVSDPAGAVYSS